MVASPDRDTLIRPANVLFAARNPAVETVNGVCVSKDIAGVVGGKCPIAELPILSRMGGKNLTEICIDCSHGKMNRIQNQLVPARTDYGSTPQLKQAIRDDFGNKPREPDDSEVREIILILQNPT